MVPVITLRVCLCVLAETVVAAREECLSGPRYSDNPGPLGNRRGERKNLGLFCCEPAFDTLELMTGSASASRADSNIK